jgi:hypothetical protein
VNLWFLIVFVILSAPGAIILFHKKLDPTSPRLDEPDPVLTQLPYMTPLPAPQGMKWIVPTKTLAWLREVTRSRTGSDEILSALGPGPEWEPVISADHSIQLMAAAPEITSHRVNRNRVILLIWGAKVLPKPDTISINVRPTALGSDGSNWRASIVVADPVTVPSDVRRELVSLGFGHPPTQVTWVDAVWGSPRMVLGPERITVDFGGPNEPLHTLEFAGSPSSVLAHDRK